MFCLCLMANSYFSFNSSLVCVVVFFIRGTIIFATLFSTAFYILLASFVSCCYYCMPLVTSNKNKIKWVTKQKEERQPTTTTTTIRTLYVHLIRFLLFASTFPLLIIKSKWMPNISGPMIHFASQFIFVHPFIINSRFFFVDA